MAYIYFVYTSSLEDAMGFHNIVAYTLIESFDSLQHSDMVEDLSEQY